MDSVQTFGLRVWSAAGRAAMVKAAKKRWAKMRKEAKNVKRSNSDATILRGGTRCRQDIDSRDHYALAALGDGRRLIYEIAEVPAMDFCLYASAPANGRFRAVHVTELPAESDAKSFCRLSARYASSAPAGIAGHTSLSVMRKR